MRNVLSYIGMSLQSEVCLWTLLGLVRTIFDATLFKVNANLKQVWQMSMPEELSLPVQRVLRTMISGIMLVQCFTVYVYLASYIVLMYPVFLEERPTLVLPWLLLAAIRKLLCELTSLALGLGICVLLGAARPPCIKFVVIKIISIMPSFYMWMLLYSYYHVLKVASVFKTFPVVLPPSENDYGLELAVRRRRTKSLQGEEQLRRRLISNFYNDRHPLNTDVIRYKPEYSSRMTHATDTSAEDNLAEENAIVESLSATPNPMMSDSGCYEDWLGSEVMVPRDSDRIMEQFGVMMLRIGAYLSKGGTDSTIFDPQLFSSGTHLMEHIRRSNHDCTTMPPDDTETPPLVGSSREGTASYLRDYPQIFRKKPSDIPLHTDVTLTLTPDERIATSQMIKNSSQVNDSENVTSNPKCSIASLSDEVVSVDTETPCASKSISTIETSQKKMQTMSSDKSVTFQSGKTRVPSTQRAENEKNQLEVGSSKPVNDRSTNLEKKDSESSIKDIKNRRQSLKLKSVNKDETTIKTRSGISRQDNKSRGSSDSSMSNNSNIENKKNK